MDERLANTTIIPTDADDTGLRPKMLDEYIGQEQIKSNLKVFIQAAKSRNEALDHILLYGPPGLGKTTLSHIIANEMGAQIRLTSGPAIERAGDLAAILTNLAPFDILFVDEIHRLSKPVEEILYSAMEDYALDIVIGKGPAARNMRISLPPFTLVGATTRVGMLTGPLRDRFGIVNRLEMYTENELCEIIKRTSRVLNFGIDLEASRELARRSRGTPRIANRLFKRVRDFATVQNMHSLNYSITKSSLDEMDIDSVGLDYLDRKILIGMIERFNGGPVGLDTIAASINEDSMTIEDAIEPYLLQIGYLIRTPRGRVVSAPAYAHLGMNAPKRIEQLDFLA